MSTENVILLKGRLDEVLYDLVDGELVESARYHLCAGGCCGSGDSCCGCVVPKGVWHTVEMLEPSVIYEAKDGKYGEDGSETLDEY